MATKIKARVFNIMQYVYHPHNQYHVDNGDLVLNDNPGMALIDEDRIKKGLSYRSIKEYAYILHDSDVYNDDDEKRDTRGIIKSGMTKPPHYHIVLKCDNAVEISSVATWFTVAENFVDVPKGRGAFLDCCEYLTHETPKEQAKGKHLYADDLIISNSKWRAELTKRKELRLKLAKKGGNLETLKDMLRYEVLYEGKTLNSIIKDDPIAYQTDMQTLDKFRIKYLTKFAKPPTIRLNYYISGLGGVGKGLISRALARALYPNLEDDNEIFFEVGAKGVPFEHYDGQPVIIWNDRRAYDLIDELGGRGNVFDVFDTHPTNSTQNIKYGSINLVNSYNIVNSVEDYTKFLDGLVGEYVDRHGIKHKVEDKSQSARRFPFILPLHEDDFDILMNKGFAEGTREYEQYIEYKGIMCNMRRIREVCGNNEILARKIETMSVSAIKALNDDLITKHQQNKNISDDEIIQQFLTAGYGQQRPLQQNDPVWNSDDFITDEDTD